MVKQPGEAEYTPYAEYQIKLILKDQSNQILYMEEKKKREKNPVLSYNDLIFNSHEQGHLPDFLTATLPFYLL